MGKEGGDMKRMVLVIVAVTMLVAMAATAAIADSNVSPLGGYIGIGPTHLLADGTLDPRLA